MSKASAPAQPSEFKWFLATATLFFTRAMLFSTWLSQIPATKELLHLETDAMGWLIMAYPAGCLLGIVFANGLTHRFGAKTLTIWGYAISTVGLIASGWAIQSGNVWLSALLLLIVGLPMAISDYVGNFEGASVNRVSKRSLMPAIHGSFGVGMVLAAWLSAALIANHVSLLANFAIISVFVFVPAVWAAGVFPVRHEAVQTLEQKQAIKSLNRWAWRDSTTLLLAVMGFTFIMAEVAVNNWVPLALTGSGFSNAEAATALSVFWIIVTVVRAVGGPIVDRLGRLGTMLTSIAVNAVGVVIFMFDPVLHAPYLGIALWATGLSLGFPIIITALGSDETKASARVNMMITVVYISSVTVGPALGSLANVIGLYASFGVPLVMLAISAVASRVLKRV